MGDLGVLRAENVFFLTFSHAFFRFLGVAEGASRRISETEARIAMVLRGEAGSGHGS